jgi:hypothetical protein
MIDPRGRILAEIPLGQAGFVDAALPEPAAHALCAHGRLAGSGRLFWGFGALAAMRTRNRH